MKKNITALPSVFALLLAFGSAALAQTPDGQTPAEEYVCDVLKEDGTTKGLYGLCVAFCEAQDHASISESITEEELASLEAAIPSGRILENYNKRKKETDPAMPCIKVEEPCPCWTEEEFLGTSQAAHDAAANSNVCSDNWRQGGSLHSVFDTELPQNLVLAFENGMGIGPYCQYYSEWDGTDGIRRLLFITPEEFGACRDRIIARHAELGLTPSTTFHRKPYCNALEPTN